MDRRVWRTRGRLQHAHTALILKKGYETTTVKDICDAAKVSRSTFYAHYTSKADLRRSCFMDLRRHLAEHQLRARSAPAGKGAGALAFSLPMFEHARDYIHMYRALVGGRGAAISMGEIREIIAELARAEFRVGAAVENGANDPAAREARVAYVVGAFMAVLTWWLESGAKWPPERVDALFRRFATHGVAP